MHPYLFIGLSFRRQYVTLPQVANYSVVQGFIWQGRSQLWRQRGWARTPHEWSVPPCTKWRLPCPWNLSNLHRFPPGPLFKVSAPTRSVLWLRVPHFYRICLAKSAFPSLPPTAYSAMFVMHFALILICTLGLNADSVLAAQHEFPYYKGMVTSWASEQSQFRAVVIYCAMRFRECWHSVKQAPSVSIILQQYVCTWAVVITDFCQWLLFCTQNTMAQKLILRNKNEIDNWEKL